jgi:hypothetical protein
MEVGGQRHAPAALPPGKTRSPLYRRLGVPQGLFRRVRQISPRPGFDPRTVQPVASRYIEWALPAHCYGISIKHSECVSVAFVIQQIKRLRNIILSSVICPALPHLSTFSLTRHDFRKNRYWTLNVCFDFLYTFSLQFFFFCKKNGPRHH